MDPDNEQELLTIHAAQLQASSIPQAKWKALLRKLTQGTFDAGESFFLALADDDDAEEAEEEDSATPPRLQVVVAKEEGILRDAPEAIWLVDHAFSFLVSQAPTQILRHHPGLLKRMQALVGVDEEEEEEEEEEEVVVEEEADTLQNGDQARPAVASQKEEDRHTSDTPPPASPATPPHQNNKKTDVPTRVMQGLWRYANMYKVSNGAVPCNEAVWYIMDEFGCRIGHADSPAASVQMIPFYFQPEQCMYSVFWPLADLKQGQEITRDYLPHEKDEYLRRGKLLAFSPDASLPEPGTLLPLPPSRLQGDDSGPPIFEEENNDIVNGSLGEGQGEGEVAWDGAELRARARGGRDGGKEGGGPVRVHTDLVVIHETLTDPRFVVVGNEEEADVYWATPHISSFQNFVKRHPRQLVGQLPNQKRLVCKDLLLETCCRAGRRSSGSSSSSGSDPISSSKSGSSSSSSSSISLPRAARHLPLSYNLETSLHDFIRECQRRATAIATKQKENKSNKDKTSTTISSSSNNSNSSSNTSSADDTDNVWIVKPWNQGRSQGVVVTESLPQILRLMETGPKVVCKYITRPVTLQGGHKFDLRLYLLVRKGAPKPEAYLHRRVLCRMSNEVFSLADWENFGRHMTVFHYRADMLTKHQLEFEEFMKIFDEEYGMGAYAKAREGMEVMAADVLEAACFFGDDCSEEEDEKTEGVVGGGKGGSTGGRKMEGMGHLARGRALLGLDVMLEWVGDEETGKVMVPRLLEVTYAPDLRRVLREHVDFVNEVFQTLIYDEPPAEAVTRIL